MNRVIFFVLLVLAVSASCFYWYMTRPVEIVVRDYNQGCNGDEKAYTIVEVPGNPDSRLLYELVFLHGSDSIFHKGESDTLDIHKEFRLIGTYSIFENDDWQLGCSGTHDFDIQKVVSVRQR
jgi:hypothetical protein